MRSLAEIIITMPAVASSTSTGYSNFSVLACAQVVERQQQRRRRRHRSVSTFMKRPKPSTTKAPSNKRVRARRLLQDEPRRQRQHADRQPADGLGLAVALGPEHAQHQQRHGADDEHELGIKRPVCLELVHGSAA